uniref:Conserved oligomeric Golgi complex subunit 4 n=2 Tax=Plectus sambesii TaxID=2011161 RepID=A0A914WXH7_9BILA
MSLELEIDFSARIAELQKQLTLKRQEEKEMDEKIAAILRKNADMPRSLNLAVARIKSRLTLTESDSSQLGSSLQLTSVLAENVSGKVRDLDVAKTRVVECLQRVDDLLDLRLCTEGVQAALLNEDYEQAAQHIHRFLALDNAVFQMGEQWEKESKASGHTMKHSYEVLRQAEKDLKTLVEQKFDEAVKDGDVASMERFFKIFPLLNQHEVGLERFGRYLCTKIADFADTNYQSMVAGGGDAKRNNVLYADTLTLLFEGIARIVEIHQPLVELYYGQDKMLILIKHLQGECDVQTEKIVNVFIKNRQYEGKAKLIDTYARQATKYANLEKLDALELDVLLSEVTLMHTRAELYMRFLRRRVAGENAKERDGSAHQAQHHPAAVTAQIADAKADRQKRLDQLLNESKLGRRMQELLGQYIMMEQYFMSESVKKAVAMDVREGNSLTSSMLDDIFFIVRKCVRRSLSSSSIDCVCAMLNNGVAMLETDFFVALNQGIKSGYPATGALAEAYQTAAAAYQVIQHGGKMSAESGPTEKQREEFLTALNNLRAACECIKTLKESLSSDFAKHLTQQNEVQKAKLEHAHGQLDELSVRFESAAKHGVEALVTAAVKTRLRAAVEPFLDVTHTPNESEFADLEANDPFMDGFVAALDKLIASFEHLLVQANYQDLLAVVCSETARQLEKVVGKAVFNRLGGLQLDKELRQLTGYLTSVGGWTVREKCARLTQITSLLNVETVDEAADFYQQSAVTWRLTPSEVRKFLALRVDLAADDIRNLKL